MTFEQLSSLLDTVFRPTNSDKVLTIMVDLPTPQVPDTTVWRERREMALAWHSLLLRNLARTAFSHVLFCCYPNVGSNNNDLPLTLFTHDTPDKQDLALTGKESSLADVLGATSVLLALTEFSATAPLKVLAKRYGFRGATMPGFTRKMLPALTLDYEKINKRVMMLKSRLDEADYVSAAFRVHGNPFLVRFDTRYRQAHASSGLLREPGMVGNLPSGEAYIVPYEGELPGEPSGSSGNLPVQFGDEIVIYEIQNNRARRVLSSGERSQEEARKLEEEPAYGNIAEVGFGVLGEWGIIAIGTVLLDEKLGLHVAFGRSEHFGGITGPGSFKDKKRIEHTDRVYVPSLQPDVSVDEVWFHYPDRLEELVMKAGAYVI